MKVQKAYPDRKTPYCHTRHTYSNQLKALYQHTVQISGKVNVSHVQTAVADYPRAVCNLTASVSMHAHAAVEPCTHGIRPRMWFVRVAYIDICVRSSQLQLWFTLLLTKPQLFVVCSCGQSRCVPKKKKKFFINSACICTCTQ